MVRAKIDLNSSNIKGLKPYNEGFRKGSEMKIDFKGMVKQAKTAGKPGNTPESGQKGIKWIVMESLLLDGEQILLVMEKQYLREARKAHPDKTLYFPPEVEELHPHRHDTDLLRAVHLVKSKFKGWIVPSTSHKGDPERGTTKHR